MFAALGRGGAQGSAGTEAGRAHGVAQGLWGSSHRPKSLGSAHHGPFPEGGLWREIQGLVLDVSCLRCLHGAQVNNNKKKK